MGEFQCPPPIRTQDGQEYFIVKKIVKEKKEDDRLMYKVRWEGYPPEEDTWKDAKELKTTCKYVVKAWKEKKEKKKAKKRRNLMLLDENIDKTSSNQNRLEINQESASESSIIIPKKKLRQQIKSSIEEEFSSFDGFNDSSSSFAGSSKENHRTIESIDNANDCVSLEDMVNNNEVEVIFCDIRYQMKFNIKPNKSNGVIYIKNANKCPSLEELKEEDIKFVYASYKSKSTEVPYILVKLHSIDAPKTAVASYKLYDFFKKFPQHSNEFSNAVRHYQQHYSTALENIERLKNEVDEFRKIWSEISHLSDDEKVTKLPKKYHQSDKLVNTIIDEYIQEMVNKNKELYFNMLAKEFGDLQTKSCNGCSCLKTFGEIYEKRNKQFSSIKRDILQNWIDTYCKLYSLPKQK